MTFLHTTYYFYKSSLYLKIKEFNRALYKIQNVYLVPAHVGAGLEHVISVPSRDGDEGNGGGVVADLLDEARHLLLDLLESVLAVGGLGRVHLVDTNDELLHSKSVGKQSVFSGLSVLGDTGLELTST